jgi:hypothetical protein
MKSIELLPTTKLIVKKLLRIKPTPRDAFLNDAYIRHDKRRQEHLASLGLDIAGRTMLEVGAGIGNHTSFFLDRGCEVVSSEAREENLEMIRARFPNIEVRRLDLDAPDQQFTGTFDIVYCYGLLYHLKDPTGAIEFMAQRCRGMLVLETCVSYGDEERINLCDEPADVLSQSVHGQGCRPTRPWVHNQLKRHFEYVYMPVTQPNHEEFPIDWSNEPTIDRLTRAIFVASRQSIENSQLVEHIPKQQRRHK